MRNIFDQYKQNENRLTHALASALHHDGELRADFLKKFFLDKNAPPDARAVCVTEQTYPGRPSLSDDEAEERGVPDIWIFDEASGWCAVVECKITSRLFARQVRQHCSTALKRGFERVVPVTITVTHDTVRLPKGTIQLLWSELFSWLNGYSTDRCWPFVTARYFEVLEARMVEDEQLEEGTITKFTGFHFRNPEDYSYLEAKRILGLALKELREDRDLIKATRMNRLLDGRGAITGQGDDHVWDFLKIDAATNEESHTKHVHLTLAIERRTLEAMVTIPDKIDGSARKRFRNLGVGGFLDLLRDIAANMRPILKEEPLAAPTIYVTQRRYSSPKAVPVCDAVLIADLRTAIESTSKVKIQPQWVEAAYEAFSNRRSNLQMGIGMIFPYAHCPNMGSDRALGLISRSWIACSPVIGVMHPVTQVLSTI